jgi:hypothetical protein
MSPFGQKLTWTALGLGAAAFAQLVLKGGDAAELFMYTAAAIIGGVWIRSPGDVSIKEAVRTFGTFTDERKP